MESWRRAWQGSQLPFEALRRCRVGGTTPKVDFRLMALTETVESLSQTAKDLAEMRSTEWMTAEQAAKHLGCGSAKAFEKIAAREGIPKHYLSPRAPATTALSSTSGSWSGRHPSMFEATGKMSC